MKHKPSRPVEELFSDIFADEKAVITLLNISLEDEHDWAFFASLKEVIDCGEVNKSSLARKTKLSRVHLYRILSKTGNPSFKTVMAILDVLGLEFQVRAKPKTSRKSTAKKPAKAKVRARKGALKR